MRKKKDHTLKQTNFRLEALKWIHEHILEAIYQFKTVYERFHALQKEPLEHLPNILFYGPVRFPLEYMGYALFHKQHVPIKRKHLWEDKLPYYECEHFFEIQCNHPLMPKNYDILCDFMKHILTSHCIHHSKHVMILRDIDIITQSEYHFALRVLLERYSHNVLFIATTHHISKMEAPLLSRFMAIRVAQPTFDELESMGRSMAPSIEPSIYLHERDFLATLFRLYYCTHGQQEVCLELSNKELEEFLSKTRSFEEVRQFAYRMFQKGLPLAEFCNQLIDCVKPVKYQSKLTSELASLEHALALSSKGREPIYYEKALWITIYASSLWKSLVR